MPAKMRDAKKTCSVLRLRASVLETCRSWLNSKGFVEVQGPIILPAVGETTQGFEVKYFGEKASLSGGLQPYSDSFVEMFGKIYTVAPTFRAEPLRDNRHLAEFWRIEVAAADVGLDGVISIFEDLISNCCRVLIERNAEELRQLSRFDALSLVKAPFSRLTYDEAVERLRGSGYRVSWGEPLSWELERRLSLMFDKPFFVRDFPVSGENVLFRSCPRRPEISLCFDLLAPAGYGEIGGGGEAVTKKRDLVEKLQQLAK